MALYEDIVREGKMAADPRQKEAMQLLQVSYERLIQQSIIQPQAFFTQSWFHKVFDIGERFFAHAIARKNSSQPEKGLLGCYIWGGVGRGKTQLMDLFFECIPPTIAAKRTHFHRFMAEIHQNLDRFQGIANPLDKIAEKLALEYQLICMDEFVVIDITDAMLLGGLVEACFKRGVMLVTTSNVPPQDLYKNGLQRDRFLPAIRHLNFHLIVFHLDSKVDYRLRSLTQLPAYVCLDQLDPKDPNPEVFKKLSLQESAQAGRLEIGGRFIPYRGLHTELIWFDFNVICGDGRSVRDYIEIAKDFKTVLISSLPKMSRQDDAYARRFVHLVDEFYDRGIRLFLTAVVPIMDIYTGFTLSFEFERTTSRLIEMQSTDYLGAINSE